MRTPSVKAFMPAMAAQAEKGLVLFQQIVGNGAVHVMAEFTIFFDRGVLIQEGALLIGMALVTEVIDGNVLQAIFLGTVGAVAGAAVHFAFPYGMVRWKFRQHLHLLMAVIAECGIPLVEHLCLGNLVGLVALIASHIAQGVKAVSQLKSGSSLRWQVRQMAELSAGLSLSKLTVCSIFPLEDTWALPGPWHPSHPLS